MMKTFEDTSLRRGRRTFLSSLVSLPILLYFCMPGRSNNSSVAAIGDSDEFVILNGWVLLKQDIAE